MNTALTKIIKSMNIDEYDRFGGLPLIYAVRRGELYFVRLLLENGIDIGEADSLMGHTALHWAVAENKEDTVRLLFDFGVSPDIRTKGEEGLTPLMIACDRSMIRLLLSYGADINASDKNGRTALYHQMYSETLFEKKDGSHENIHLLLDAGANLHIKDRQGRNVLHYVLDPYSYEGDNIYNLTKLLIDYGADVNKGTPKARDFPLILAAQRGDEEIVKLLLESGADIKAGEETGKTAFVFTTNPEIRQLLSAAESTGPQAKQSLLHEAIQQNESLETIEKLFKSGISIEELDKQGNSPLKTAIEYNRPDVVRLLLLLGADIQARITLYTPVPISHKFAQMCEICDMYSPLHFAVQQETLEIVRVLLEFGADVQAQSLEGKGTPLHYAVWKGNVDIINLLISHGTHINVLDNAEMNPLMMTFEGKNQIVADILIKAGADVTDLKTFKAALQAADVETVRLFLQAGVDLRSPNILKALPLYFAVYEGRDDLIQLLLDYGASVDEIADEGITPLFFAVQHGTSTAVRVLLACGANVNATDPEGKTMLSCAISRRNAPEIIKILMEHGADRSYIQNSPILFEAIKKNQHSEVVSLLLHYGAEVNVKDKENNTLLHFLVKAGSSFIADKENIGTIKILLERGADVNAQNDKGFTPLMNAVQLNRAEYIEVLLCAGADVTLKNNMKQTAMDYARRPGNEKIMHLLQTHQIYATMQIG